jgi:hypothetical protein
VVIASAGLIVNAAAALLLWPAQDPATATDPPGTGPSPAAVESVRSAVGRGDYPWYEPASDRVRPVLPWPDFDSGPWKRFSDRLAGVFRTIGGWFRWLNRWRVPGVAGLGDVVAIGLVLLVLTVVLVGLLELLRRYRPLIGKASDPRVTVQAGREHRIEGLPAGVRLDGVDPWAEARRRRAVGDYAGAVIYLFAHQLLALERVRQLRLVPGRTGRQLVRSVPDRPLRATVEPTLRLFEQVYYGHRAPTAEAFEAVWAQAEAFERLLAARVEEAVP